MTLCILKALAFLFPFSHPDIFQVKTSKMHVLYKDAGQS